MVYPLLIRFHYIVTHKRMLIHSKIIHTKDVKRCLTHQTTNKASMAYFVNTESDAEVLLDYFRINISQLEEFVLLKLKKL